jgi:hypothetical protein
VTTYERYIEGLKRQGKICRVVANTITGKQILEINKGKYYSVWVFDEYKHYDFPTFHQAREFCNSSWI